MVFLFPLYSTVMKPFSTSSTKIDEMASIRAPQAELIGFQQKVFASRAID